MLTGVTDVLVGLILFVAYGLDLHRCQQIVWLVG